MNESMLNTFIRFIAGVSIVRSNVSTLIVRKYLDSFIERNFGKRIVNQCVNKFDLYLEEYKASENKSIIIQSICKSINKEFSLTQRFLLIINLFNFFTFSTSFTLRSKTSNQQSNPEDELDQIAEWLKIDKIEFANFRLFSSGQLHSIPNRENLLIVSENNPNISGTTFLQSKGIKGFITFLHLKTTDQLVFIYNGTSPLEINGKPIYNKLTYLLSSGAVIGGKNISPIYFGNIIKRLTLNPDNKSLTLTALGINFNYPKSEQGIKNLSLAASSGELMGIMGGSGVGKSTLVKILSGSLKPRSGEVLINGHNIYQLSKKELQFIGVMHQEECLLEELTVYENLYLSAKLSIGKRNVNDIRKLVEEKLFELDLNDCKNNRVGTPDNRELSGGQRKRLAIAMELIRKPKVLFVDEPTSGLSSADSLLVMKILKDIALRGPLVVVNIHQPSSDIYKLFNSIVIIDKGGVPVFNGDPAEAILHFKRETARVDKDQSACECCGTIKPEQIFELLEEQQIDEMGQVQMERKLNPMEWNDIFKEKMKSNPILTPDKLDLPQVDFELPNITKQFNTFFARNLLAKLRNKQFLFFSLVLPPILATIIALFLRHSTPSAYGDHGYSLYSNPNLASFFLMAILSSLFFGLIISCEDIIKDKRIINREGFIGLNIKSYLNAKFSFHIILSAIQTISFALPGLLILEVKGITITLWFILFLLSLFGNLLGLILSTTLKSVVAIYVIVPFLLIPQILFSGLVVQFHNLNPKLTSKQYVPIVGETMPTRWAVEATLVYFFKNNKYYAPFFNIDFIESELRFRLLHLIPELNQLVNSIAEKSDNIDYQDISTLENGISLLLEGQNLPKPTFKLSEWSDNTFDDLSDFLLLTRNELSKRYSNLRHKRDNITESIYPNTQVGRLKRIYIREKYHNNAIEDLLRNKHYPLPLIRDENIYLQKSDPIYQISKSSIGRSHFFAAYKTIGNSIVETFWFNVFVLILMIGTFYILFIFRIFMRMFKM